MALIELFSLCRHGLGTVVGDQCVDEAGKTLAAQKIGQALKSVIGRIVLNYEEGGIGGAGDECYVALWMAVGNEMSLVAEDGKNFFMIGAIGGPAPSLKSPRRLSLHFVST